MAAVEYSRNSGAYCRQVSAGALFSPRLTRTNISIGLRSTWETKLIVVTRRRTVAAIAPIRTANGVAYSLLAPCPAEALSPAAESAPVAARNSGALLDRSDCFTESGETRNARRTISHVEKNRRRFEKIRNGGQRNRKHISPFSKPSQ